MTNDARIIGKRIVSQAILPGWECSGCGISGWAGRSPAVPIYFQKDGTQRIRAHSREDGVATDQIVLAPSSCLTNSPGALKNDTTILIRL